MSRAHWDDSEYRWHVFTESGSEYVAQFLISGAGALHIPRMPDIEGMDEFRGAAFHSAQWDHSVDLTGKRVAVIGTGASAIQIVPELVRREAGVAEVQLYQRTPPWVVPRPNSLLPDAVRKAFANVPGLRLAVRSGIYWGLEGLGFAMTQRPEPAARRRTGRQVEHSPQRSSDKELRRRLTPNYRAGCKRILYSGQLLPGGRQSEDDADHRPDQPHHRRRHRHRRRRRAARSTSSCTPPASTPPTPTPTSTSRARAARTWWIAGTGKASWRTAASRSPTCPTCSSCSGPTPGWATPRWCS